MSIKTLAPVALSVTALIFSGCALKEPPTEPEKDVAPEVVDTPPAPKPVLRKQEPASPIIVTQAEEPKPVVEPEPPSQNMTVYFDYDSSDLLSAARELLKTHSQFLTENSIYKVIVLGHADERGSNDYNMTLGEKRTQVIKEALVINGVNKERIATISFGEERPAVQGQSEEAWRSNRRAVLVYVKGDLAQAMEEQRVDPTQVFAFDN